MSRTLKIDRELRSLLRPLDEGELSQLRSMIEADGCLDAIKVWKGHDIIVDGHHRYDLCRELGCEFDVQELPFPDKAAIAAWMLTLQGGRRNMTPAAISAARGLSFNSRKQQQGGNRKRDQPPAKVRGEPSSDEWVSENDTAAQVALETGVSRATVKRDGKFQSALAKLAEKTREAILAGVVLKPSTKALERLSEYDAASQSIIIEAVRAGDFANISAALDAEETEEPEPKAVQEIRGVDLAIQNGKALHTIVGLLQKAKRECKAIEEQPGLEIFVSREKGIQRDIDAAIGAIQVTIPHAVCPRCNGQCCIQCGNHGWVNKTLFKSLEDSGE